MTATQASRFLATKRRDGLAKMPGETDRRKAYLPIGPAWHLPTGPWRPKAEDLYDAGALKRGDNISGIYDERTGTAIPPPGVC